MFWKQGQTNLLQTVWREGRNMENQGKVVDFWLESKGIGGNFNVMENQILGVGVLTSSVLAKFHVYQLFFSLSPS